MGSIVLLATAWGPKFGGINSFNMDLAKALGPLLAPETRVLCVVHSASVEEREDARHSQVELVDIGAGASAGSIDASRVDVARHCVPVPGG